MFAAIFQKLNGDRECLYAKKSELVHRMLHARDDLLEISRDLKNGSKAIDPDHRYDAFALGEELAGIITQLTVTIEKISKLGEQILADALQQEAKKPVE